MQFFLENIIGDILDVDSVIELMFGLEFRININTEEPIDFRIQFYLNPKNQNIYFKKINFSTAKLESKPFDLDLFLDESQQKLKSSNINTPGLAVGALWDSPGGWKMASDEEVKKKIITSLTNWWKTNSIKISDNLLAQKDTYNNLLKSGTNRLLIS